MKKQIFLSPFVLFLCLLPKIYQAQSTAPVEIQWDQTIDKNYNDNAASVALSPDGSIGVGGNSFSGYSFDHGLLAKLNSEGDTIWIKDLPDCENIISMVANWDGGYTVTGLSFPAALFQYGSYYVARLSNSGTIMWSHSYGGPARTEKPFSISHTSDSGYIIAGAALGPDSLVTNYKGGGSDAWVVKIDSVGILQWQNGYGGDGQDRIQAIIETSDGGYAMAGMSDTQDNGDVIGVQGFSDYWLVKTDVYGAVEWTKTYGGSYIEAANTIIETSDGGYAVSGRTYSADGDVTGNHGDSDYWILKVNQSGDLQWERNYGSYQYDKPYSLIQTSDGGYVISGDVHSGGDDVTNIEPGYSSYAWILKIDSAGVPLWNFGIGNDLGNGFFPNYPMVPTSDGGYVLVGTTIGDPHYESIVFNNNIWIVKLGGTTDLDEANNDLKLSLFPNPAKTELYIKSATETINQICIYDIMGKDVITIENSQNYSANRKIRIDVSKLPAGNYFLKANTSKGIVSMPWIKN